MKASLLCAIVVILAASQSAALGQSARSNDHFTITVGPGGNVRYMHMSATSTAYRPRTAGGNEPEQTTYALILAHNDLESITIETG